MSITHKLDTLSLRRSLGQMPRRKWRAVLRGLGLFVASAMVIGCLFVILQDRPRSSGRLEGVSLAYSCPPKTELLVITVPGIDITLQGHGGYQANFSAAVASSGKGLCRVFLGVPLNSTPDLAYDPRTGVMKSVSGGVTGKEAVGTAPAYTPNWRPSQTALCNICSPLTRALCQLDGEENRSILSYRQAPLANREDLASPKALPQGNRIGFLTLV
jgi:hypothetical protein